MQVQLINGGHTLRVTVPWELQNVLRGDHLPNLARTAAMGNGSRPNTKVFEGRLEAGVQIEQVRDALDGRIADYLGPTSVVHGAVIAAPE